MIEPVEHKQLTLPLPLFLAKYRMNKKTVCIDKGIVDTIQVLWAHSVETLGCCESDPKHSNIPTVIIASHYNNEEVNKIDALLRECDKRKFIILQWKRAIIDNGDPIERLCMVGCYQSRNTWHSINCQICDTGMCFFDGACPSIKIIPFLL